MGVTCSMPNSNQLTSISRGVYEGQPVQGVRYAMEPHMSGWFITTDDYDGDVESLHNEHLCHVLEKRPDLVDYLCLPIGWRFDTRRHDVWFDESVSNQS